MHRLVLSDQVYDVENATDQNEVIVVRSYIRGQLDETAKFVLTI